MDSAAACLRQESSQGSLKLWNFSHGSSVDDISRSSQVLTLNKFSKDLSQETTGSAGGKLRNVPGAYECLGE